MSLLKVKVKVGVIKKNEHGGRLFKEAGKEDIVNCHHVLINGVPVKLSAPSKNLQMIHLQTIKNL